MKTNKIFKLQIWVVLICLMPACQSLEEQPEDFFAPENFFNNEAEAEAVLNGAYGAFSGWNYYGRAFYKVVGYPTDDYWPANFASATELSLDEFYVEPENGELFNLWNRIYESLKHCNLVIDNVPGISMNEERKASIMAEAYFLRALDNFNLVRIWGSVPMLLSSKADIDELRYKTGDPVEKIYERILADLAIAERDLPVAFPGEEGRATKGAAQALLSEVYLTLQQWQKAADKAKEIIDRGTYSLFPNYQDLWLVANENGREHIFSAQSKSLTGPLIRITRQMLPVEHPLVKGNSICLAEMDFFNSFDPADERKGPTFMTEFTDENGNVVTYHEWQFNFPHIAKYSDPGPDANLNRHDGNANWVVFRYAEILLIYAEALNEAEGGPSQAAYDAINQVRDRASLEDLPLGLSQEAFRQAVMQERRWELCYEGKRWFDLIRWGTLVETMQTSRPKVREHHKLMPIPQREIELNPNLAQNVGY